MPFPGLAVFCWLLFTSRLLTTSINPIYQTHPQPPTKSRKSPKMASPLSSDIPKPYGSTEKVVKDVNRAFALPVPAFGDLSKAANDVC